MRHLTDLEKIECAEYVIDVLDRTKRIKSNEHSSWMARARALLKERASKYLKIRNETGNFS